MFTTKIDFSSLRFQVAMFAGFVYIFHDVTLYCANEPAGSISILHLETRHTCGNRGCRGYQPVITVKLTVPGYM